MSNINKPSKAFDPTISPQNYYQQIGVKNKEDIVATIENLPSGFFRDKSENFKSNLPSLGLSVKRNNNSVLSERLNKHSYDLAFQRKADTKDDLGLIPADRTCDKDEQSVIKYGLDNLPNIIDKLLKENGKVFSIVTDKKVFNILLDASNVPHILGLLNLNDAKQNDTRLYIEAVNQLEMLPNLSKKHMQKEYLEIIKSIVYTYKEILLYTYANVDDYKKDLLGKISFKVCNLEYVMDKITINEVNSIKIFKARSDKDSYLLTIPLGNNENDSYCCLMITKSNVDEFTYALKSGGILTSKEYKELSINKQFSEVWDNANLSGINLLFKTGNNTIRMVNELEEIRNKKCKSFNGSETYTSKDGMELNVIAKDNKKIIAREFNEMVTRNNNSILSEIHNLLISSNKEQIKDYLPLLLIKLYQNYREKEKTINDEDYYKTLMMLSSEFGTYGDIKELINACYSNDINKISSLIKTEDISCEWESSVSISKVNDEFYLNATLNFESILLKFNIGRIDGENFITQIENINKQFEDIYKKIQQIKINNINDAKKYILLMTNYYNAYEMIQSSIINLYANYISKNTTLENILTFAESYPDIFNYLTELGYDKLEKDNKNFQQMIDEGLKEKKEYKDLVNEISDSNNKYTFDSLFDKLTLLSDDDSLFVIKIVSLKLLKDIVSQLTNANYIQVIQTNADKLNTLLEVRKHYSDVKILEKVG